MLILSLCTSAGLWDRAWIDAGHDVIPGCELMAHKRDIYEVFCGKGEKVQHVAEDLYDLPDILKGLKFDGIIGGIPCQSRSKIRNPNCPTPKFGDLLSGVLALLSVVECDWYIFENVAPLEIPGSAHCKMNAANYQIPHQSRLRYFTHSPNLSRPKEVYPGSIDDLYAYSVVAGRIYGPKRGAYLQGWPEFAELSWRFSCRDLQESLADGVPRGLAEAWVREVESKFNV